MAEAASFEVIQSALPAIAVLLPLLGAIVTYPLGKYIKEEYSGYAASITTIFAFLVTALNYQYILHEKVIEFSLTSTSTLFPVKFYLDSFGFIFATITSFIWMLTTIYSIRYMDKEHASPRFYFFLLLTLTANLGVVMGGDLFSVYIFFELLAVFSLILVVHEETKEAMEAGKLYFYIGVLGGLSLLLGIFILFTQTGNLSYGPQLETLKELGNTRFLIAGLMIIGFGVKAGIFPIHIWLPKAHPVAPTPASALLSGIMVKAGIYGIFRTTGRLFTPQEVAHVTENFWTLGSIGYWVIWIAIITAFLGWVLALLQDNMKKLLAYSTISQIGYITLGIGAAAYLGYEGTYGYSGALYHVFNHAMFKTALFLVAGVIYYRTRTLKMSKLGGLWKEMPYTTLIAIIAAAGIAGIPFFNGYISKTLLHHGIVEAFHLHEDLSLHIAEILFVVTGGGTLAYYLKFIGYTFFGEKKYPDKVKKAPKLMIAPMAIIASIIIFNGLFPKILLNNLIAPSLEMEALNLHHVEHLMKINFYSIHNLSSIAMSLVIGTIIYIYTYHYNIMEKDWPHKLGVSYLYKKIAQTFVWMCRTPVTYIDKTIDSLFLRTSKGFLDFCTGPSKKAEDGVQKGYKKTAKSFLKLTKKTRGVDREINKEYKKTADSFLELTKKTSGIDEEINKEYKKASKKAKKGIEDLEKGTDYLEANLEDLSKKLLYRNPVEFLKILGLIISNTVIKRILTIFLYPYIFIKTVYVSLTQGPGKINYTIKEEVKRMQKEDISITPRMGSMGFALFLIAVVLSMYLIFELLNQLGIL